MQLETSPQAREAVPADLLPHLRRAKDLADSQFAEAVDLDRLAASAGCSRFHFLRMFRATYGETPGRYLSRRRVERAATLLRSANLTVTEVCQLVGFTSLGSFSVRFKEVYGVAPSLYRDRAAAQGGPPPVPGCFVLMWSGLSASPAPLPAVPEPARPVGPDSRNRGEAATPSPAVRSGRAEDRLSPTSEEVSQ